ncbi:MAG: DUF4358 domain-containing protein [Firmicutes bacterium]|nr:DUF4358 domain-containing protein [Bacillota bacterium]
MKKVLMIFLCALLMLTSACGGGKTKELNITELAEQIKASGAFEENISSNMEAMKASRAIKMYGAEEADVADAAYYTCIGATAAEILILQGTDEAAAKKLYELADDHLAELKASYENYAPEEAKKVDNAVSQQYGKYVIIVVCANPDKAEAVITEATK